MRLLDQREQKSPRVLFDEFSDLVSTTLEVGDYFSGNMEQDEDWETLTLDGLIPCMVLKGNLVEFKFGSDFGIHTEPLERFQDELYRMACYRQKNPHVMLHAVWIDVNIGRKSIKEIKQWYHYCQKYHVWGHLVYGEEDFIELLKKLDQPKSYVEFEPYIKRSHEEPTDLAKALRIPHGVSSDVAQQLAACQKTQEFIEVIGMKKKGGLKKLGVKIFEFLQTLDRYYNRIDCSRLRELMEEGA